MVRGLRRSGMVALLASAVLHLGVAVELHRERARLERPDPAERPERSVLAPIDWVELELLEEEQAARHEALRERRPSARAAAEPPEARAEARHPAARPARAGRLRGAAVEAELSRAAVPPPRAEPETTVDALAADSSGPSPARAAEVRETRPSGREAGAAKPLTSLTPRAAALSLLGESPSCLPPAEADACSDEPVSFESARSHALSDGLRRDVLASARQASRDGPELRRGLDGAYRYRGHAFDATIDPSGHVSFEDRIFEASINPFVSGLPVADGALGNQLDLQAGLMLRGRFDLSDLIQRDALGDEIYAVEKHWFLEQTRALRERLAGEQRAAERERAMLRLRARLLRIVDDPERSPAHKRLAVFALWDDCALDDEGRDVQRAVEAFVRERMPKGSALGYGVDELRALNARRASRRPFAPYG